MSLDILAALKNAVHDAGLSQLVQEQVTFNTLPGCTSCESSCQTSCQSGCGSTCSSCLGCSVAAAA